MAPEMFLYVCSLCLMKTSPFSVTVAVVVWLGYVRLMFPFFF